MMLDWKLVRNVINQVKNKIQGDHLPEDLMEQLEARADGIFNPIEALDSEQIKIYEECKKLKAELDDDLKAANELKTKLEAKVKRMKNLENNFTSGIELKHNLDNKMWRVNEKTSMVEVFDQERALKEMKEMGLNEMLPPGIFGFNDNDSE